MKLFKVFYIYPLLIFLHLSVIIKYNWNRIYKRSITTLAPPVNIYPKLYDWLQASRWWIGGRSYFLTKMQHWKSHLSNIFNLLFLYSFFKKKYVKKFKRDIYRYLSQNCMPREVWVNNLCHSPSTELEGRAGLFCWGG